MKGKIIILSTAILALAGGIACSALNKKEIYRPNVTLDVEGYNEVLVENQSDPFVGFDSLSDEAKIDKLKEIVANTKNGDILYYDEGAKAYCYKNMYSRLSESFAAMVHDNEAEKYYSAGTIKEFSIHNNDKLYTGRIISKDNFNSNLYTQVDLEFDTFTEGYVFDKEFNIANSYYGNLDSIARTLDDRNVRIAKNDDEYKINAGYSSFYTDGKSYLRNSEKLYFGSHVDLTPLNACLKSVGSFYKQKYEALSFTSMFYDVAQNLLEEKLSEGFENPYTQERLKSSNVSIDYHEILINLNFMDTPVTHTINIKPSMREIRYDKNNPDVQTLTIKGNGIDLLCTITNVNDLKIKGSVNVETDKLSMVIKLDCSLKRNGSFKVTENNNKINITSIKAEYIGKEFTTNNLTSVPNVSPNIFDSRREVEVVC